MALSATGNSDEANMLTCTTDSSRSEVTSQLTPESPKMSKECGRIGGPFVLADKATQQL